MKLFVEDLESKALSWLDKMQGCGSEDWALVLFLPHFCTWVCFVGFHGLASLFLFFFFF